MKALRDHRIGVLAGGQSSEREISLRSGSSVHKALRGKGLDVRLLDVTEEDFDLSVSRAGIDLAFIALHGAFGEDGTVQSRLSDMNIPYTGSGPASSRLALDKIDSRKVMASRGIRTPGYRIALSLEEAISMEITFPCVLKPRREGSSIGLSIVEGRRGLRKAFESAARHGGELAASR